MVLIVAYFKILNGNLLSSLSRNMIAFNRSFLQSNAHNNSPAFKIIRYKTRMPKRNLFSQLFTGAGKCGFSSCEPEAISAV